MTTLPTRRKLEAALASARATVALLEAELEALDTSPTGDALLDAKATLATYGVGHEALRSAAARGELAVQRGARGKLLVLESELRRWLASRPYRPTPRRQPAPANDDLEQWDRDVDNDIAELARTGR